MMRAYRALSQLHERQEAVAFGATAAGRCLIWVAATLLLLWKAPKVEHAFLMSPLLALVMLFPGRRNAILSCGSLVAVYLFVRGPARNELLPFLVIGALAIGATYFYFKIARSYTSLPSFVQRFPLLVANLPALLLMMYLGWHVVTSPTGEVDPVLLSVFWMICFLTWRWSYLLFSGRRGHVAGTHFLDHLFYVLPAYGGSNVPYGKGHDYLSAQASRGPLDMSRSQLAGLKLLILAVLWQVALRCIEVYVYGSPSRLLLSLSGGHTLGLVPMAEQLASGSPGDVSVASAWAQSFFALITQVLVIAIYGHVYIGCLRLLGFSVFRNTYKPLLAESIVEYWNRFYYYFKELLVHFFFYPTFLMGSALSPTMRIFVSIVAAAFFGNLYYHIVRDFDIYLTSTPEQAFAILVPRLIYTGFLTAGIFISMLREKKRRRRRGNTNRVPAAVLVTRIRRILGVWVFYSFLLIWIEGSDFIPFGPRFEFLLAHFGISS